MNLFKVLLLAVMCSASAVHAATLKPVAELVSSGLTQVRELALKAQADEVFGSCGIVESVLVIEKDNAEKWSQVLRQMLQAKYNEAMTISRSMIPEHARGIEALVDRAVERLDAANEDGEKKSEEEIYDTSAHRVALKHAIADFLMDDESAILYTGHMRNHGVRMNLVALVDPWTEEFVIMAYGDCGSDVD